jgi:hypothetical protein
MLPMIVMDFDARGQAVITGDVLLKLLLLRFYCPSKDRFKNIHRSLRHPGE